MNDWKKNPSKTENTKDKKEIQQVEDPKKSIYKSNQKVDPKEHTDVTTVLNVDTKEDTVFKQKNLIKEAPASLLLLNGPKDLIGQSWPLNNPVTNIGRSNRLNDIYIDYHNLSKTHFQILKEKGEFHLMDLKSTNKTYINDRLASPYQKIKLEDNSYIRASNLVFKFLSQGNIELFSSKEMLNKAQTDTLTGAWNRQFLKLKGNEYFLSNQQCSLIVFDVDNFKIINDSFGHLAGDFILKTLSQYVLETIRKGDIFIRYGGDEFCIFIPSPLSIAVNIADRIKHKIQEDSFLFEDQKISVDVSMGITEKSPKDKTWEDIYHRADKQSYKRKQRKKLQKT